MKSPPQQLFPDRGATGFTLLELSTAISLMLVLATALVVIMQQHLTFMEMAQRQKFLTNDAPQIGSLLGRIFNQADHYFVYASHDAAIAGDAPILSGGKAVRLFFHATDQTSKERLVAVDSSGGTTRLKFYTLHVDGSETSWVVSDKISDATFSASEGILAATLQGPNGEEITYSGGAR
jgi:prepilin-type N-terminal cleavage/methylation domain-containing protein